MIGDEKTLEFEFTIDKPKLRKGLSYVLKSSILKKAMKNAGLEFTVNLNYWVPQSGNSIFEVFYHYANENVNYDRLYIRAGVVESSKWVCS